MTGYWATDYWPDTNYYWPVDYWQEYGAATYELLITAGYWPTTYFPKCYWVDDYWLEYGAPAGYAHSQCVIVG